MKWKFQLIIQFTLVDDDDHKRFEMIRAFEDQLETWLSPDADLDGNDVGSGEMNIFVHTNSPSTTFESVKMLLQSKPQLANFRAAYRAYDGEEFVPLWPPGLPTFDVV